MVNGTDASFFAAFVFGALFCFAALAVLHGIVFPVEWRGTVDGECIRCYKNGVLKSEFARSDIDYVNVSALLDHSSHWIRLKDGRDLRLTKLYFEDYRKLEAALAEFAYPLKSAGVK